MYSLYLKVFINETARAIAVALRGRFVSVKPTLGADDIVPCKNDTTIVFLLLRMAPVQLQASLSAA